MQRLAQFMAEFFLRFFVTEFCGADETQASTRHLVRYLPFRWIASRFPPFPFVFSRSEALLDINERCAASKCFQLLLSEMEHPSAWTPKGRHQGKAHSAGTGHGMIMVSLVVSVMSAR